MVLKQDKQGGGLPVLVRCGMPPVLAGISNRTVNVGQAVAFTASDPGAGSRPVQFYRVVVGPPLP